MTSQSTRPTITGSGQFRPAQQATNHLAPLYDAVRGLTLQLCEPLVTEDFVIQSMPDVSPTRWHLAHTTWFFETFVLAKALSDYRVYRSEYAYLFNSYYNTVGDQFPRPRRGVLSRPTVQELFEYRAYVDEHMGVLLADFGTHGSPELAGVIELGLNHEQQHQELILTDIKHVFWCNPLRPIYRESEPGDEQPVWPMRWISHEEGQHRIGYSGDGFSYDNEHPRHRCFVQAFDIAQRLITGAEYLEFIDDRGYERPELWLSDGWATVTKQAWNAPLYWEKRGDQWWTFTLAGMRPVSGDEPVCHVSYYEADAYARWAGAWLPFESAWEVAARDRVVEGNFVESGMFQPAPVGPAADASKPLQMFGDVWEWTCSPYIAYPGYRAKPGALGEYNGKFMCNQMVLRGGSCATPRSHLRPSYRNFFPPDARWQFTGFRLAK